MNYFGPDDWFVMPFHVNENVSISPREYPG